MSLDNNPAGSPPTADAAPAAPVIEQDIADVLGLEGDTSSVADAIAGGTPPPPNEPPAGAASTPSSEAGAAVVPAPAAPVTEQTPAGEAPPAPAAATPTDGKPPAPAAPAPSEPPPAATQPPVDEAALKTASLEATVSALQAEVERLRANPQGGQPQAGQPSAPSTEQPAGEQPFRYALTLPEKVQQALLSDDPQQNVSAINTIVNDLGTIVHNTVLAQVRGEMRGMIQNLASMASEADSGQARSQAKEQAKEQYYGAFPAHKNALIEPIIVAENAKLAAAYPNSPWDQNWINALGARVNGVLEQLGAKPVEQPAVPAPNPPPSRPAAMLPAGNRGAAPTGDVSLSDEVMDTLDPFSGG